ncbi:MAG TPA: NBR1-Ig-like domain-containing protein [Anaerolineales bacterium]
MKINTNSILILFGIIAFTIMACLPVTLIAMPLLQPAKHEPVDSVATVQAVVTQTVYAMTQTAPTQTPIPPTATPVPATNTPVPTAITYCDWAAFITDVTIPDGTQFAPGEVFTKTWRLKNIGTCTWTPDYDIVFTSGAQMSGTTMQMPGYVAPGQSVDVAVTFTAPSAAGHYVGYWMLRNASGKLFGTGGWADETFYVDIYVKDLPHGTVIGNFSYPSEFNPPLMLYFENAATRETIQFSIPEKNPSYSVLLPNGTYYAYAWAPGYNLQGAYINSNLIMKTFVVKGRQTTTGIDLTDWSPYPHSYGQ